MIVNIKTVVPMGILPLPIPAFIRDDQDRLTQLKYTYQSFIVTYNVTWQGEDVLVDTFDQTFEDNV